MSYNNKVLPLTFLLGFSIIIRVIYNWGQTPDFNLDSASYDALAQQLMTFDFSNYTAQRTPGYPVLMAICGRNQVATVVTQFAMGVSITLLLFRLALMETKSTALSVFVALLYAAGLNFLYFERSIMTETFTTFLIMLSVYYFRQLMFRGNFQYTRCISIFTILCTPGLVRPMMACLPFLAAAYLTLTKSGSWFQKLKMGGLCLIPPLAIFLGLCAFNKYMVDNFNLTSLAGYSVSNHTGAFIEDAPAEYSTIANAYLDYRKIQIEKTGIHQFTIFHIKRKLQDELGLSSVELGKLLTKMNIVLIRTHPAKYARSVFNAWLNFWKAPVLFYVGGGTSLMVARCQRIIYLAANVGFFVFSLLALVRIRTLWSETKFEIFLIAVVITGSIIQAVFEYGTNARFAVPFQPIICYVDAALAWTLWQGWRKRQPGRLRV
ncbi:MAG: hypothetical protein ACLP5H_19370 [Desulfomonilaceae bacterium]